MCQENKVYRKKVTKPSQELSFTWSRENLATSIINIERSRAFADKAWAANRDRVFIDKRGAKSDWFKA